jgi:hypothetical protein
MQTTKGGWLRRHRKLALIAPVVAIAIVGGTAWAFFAASSTGSGSITGTVSNPTTAVTLTLAGSFPSTLAPGAANAVPVTVTAHNPDLSQTATLVSVHLASVTVDSAHATAGCLNSWFTMADVTENASITPSNTATLPTTGSLVMAESGSNQSACKGASVTLNLTSN